MAAIVLSCEHRWAHDSQLRRESKGRRVDEQSQVQCSRYSQRLALCSSPRVRAAKGANKSRRR